MKPTNDNDERTIAQHEADRDLANNDDTQLDEILENYCIQRSYEARNSNAPRKAKLEANAKLTAWAAKQAVEAEKRGRIEELERLAETLSPVAFDMNQKLFMSKARDERLAELRGDV